MNERIVMVDLKGQYLKIKTEIDVAIKRVIESSAFINGPVVSEFAEHLAAYSGAGYVIPCANGTDALQIALMALGLKPGDEVMVPAFTYVASVEVIALLGLNPVFVDIDPDTFNIDADKLEEVLTPRCKAVIPVHLFGQSCDMDKVMDFAVRHNLYVVEDNAQALGGVYRSSNGQEYSNGTMGHFGCTSFFPSKNLGCYGDGGALMTSDPELAAKAKMIANHGQSIKYHHEVIGCNSRLDSIQAAILDVKLKYLDRYCAARRDAAHYYTEALKDVEGVKVPYEVPNSVHVYHQYTLRVENGRRDDLKSYLASRNIPSMIYYPLPLHFQKAYSAFARMEAARNLQFAEDASETVLSLPIHTELTRTVQDVIVGAVKDFFEK